MLRNLTERGGIVVYAKNILRCMLELDRKNEYVFMYRHKESLGEYTRFSNVREHIVYAPNKLLWDQVAVPAYAKQKSLDLIYNPKLSIPLKTRCKTVLVMHGGAQFVLPHLFRWHDRLYFKTANRLFCRKADAIITGTSAGAKDIVEYMGADAAKVHVINLGYNEYCRFLDKTATDLVKLKYSLPDQFILFVGGINPVKNFSNLLKAYKKLRPEFRHKLVVVGFNRWKFSKDLQTVSELGLDDSVIFSGFVSDEELPVFYNLASVLAFPSLYEGFGIPILEAMACGCPVITTKTGCVPEVAGNAALLADPYNPDEIAELIRKVLTEQTLREQLIKKGFERAQQFSWQKSAEKTLAIFESLKDK